MKSSRSPRNTRARKPSHFGSKRESPARGRSSASFASIGSIGGAMAYNWLAPRVDIFARLLREALWAPLAILCLSVVLGPVLAAQDLWWLVHVAGGAALGFCSLRASRIALRNVRPAAAYVVAFTATCSTALGWEMLEFT